jgi:hypothetical protein
MIDRLARESTSWLERRNELPEGWEGGVIDEELLYLTASELREVARAGTELLAKYRSRTADLSARPLGSRPVRAASLVFPLPRDDADDGRAGHPQASRLPPDGH